MSDEVDKHVLRKYDISQKLGKGVRRPHGGLGKLPQKQITPCSAASRSRGTIKRLEAIVAQGTGHRSQP